MAGAKQHAHWSSRWAFMMAAVGSAVGLGNIWKFPYEAGSGGGGVFVLIYLFFIFFIGTPVLVAELSLGRRGQKSPIGSMEKIAKEEGKSKLWSLIGWSGVIGGFVVISYYSVVGGWTLAYVANAAIGAFEGVDKVSAAALFKEGLQQSETTMILWHAAFMFITIGIVAKGVEDGLEKAVTFLMPALFVLLLFMVIYAAVTADFLKALDFLFWPRAKDLTVDVALNALGQSFFSLSLALGSIMTYGSYLTKDVSIGKSAVTIAAADTLVAIMAGLAIFPLVFTYGLKTGEGPGLIFATLPIAFGSMDFGVIIGTLFFTLLAVAAITSAISLLEPAVSYVEERTSLSRRQVAIALGVAAFLIGTLSAMGMPGNSLGDVSIFGMNIMDAKGYITNNVMMPLGGLFIALFVGWFISRKTMMEELAMSEPSFRIWYLLVRFVCPIAISVVFVTVAFG